MATITLNVNVNSRSSRKPSLEDLQRMNNQLLRSRQMRSQLDRINTQREIDEYRNKMSALKKEVRALEKERKDRTLRSRTEYSPKLSDWEVRHAALKMQQKMERLQREAGL